MIYVRRVDILDRTPTCQLIVDLNKNILAPFITSLVREPGKTKLNGEKTMYCSPDSGKIFVFVVNRFTWGLNYVI